MGVTREMWRWRIGDDTGASSITIWHAITGEPWPQRQRCPSVPQDRDDFGRCLRLVERFQWRTALGMVADRHPNEWGTIVRRWDALVEAYRAGGSMLADLHAARWEK